MGIVFRQSVKTAMVTFAGAILGAALIFMSNYLVSDKQQLGFTRNLINQAAVSSQFLLLGLQGTLSVFIHRYPADDRRRKGLITICLVVPLVFIALASIVYLVFKEHAFSLFQPQDVPFIRRYFLWLPLFVLFFAYQGVLENYLTSQMKVAIASFLREVVLRLLNIVAIVLFWYGILTFDGLVAATVLIYAVPALCMLAFASRTRGFGLLFDLKVFSPAEYREIAHFSWYHALLGASMSLMGFADSLMVASLDPKGLSTVAVYSNAVFIISVLLIPNKAMNTASFPDLARAFKDNDMVRAKDVFVRSSTNILLASVAAILVVCCNLPNLVTVLPAGFEPITLLVLIMLVGRLIDIATGMNDSLIAVSPYYKFSFYMSTMLVVFMVSFNLALIPRYGAYGAAWGTSIAFVLYNIGKFVFVYRKMGIQPFSANTLRIAVCGISAFLPGYLLPFILNPYVDTVIRSVAIFAVYVAMLLWLKPSADLETYLVSIKKNKRLF